MVSMHDDGGHHNDNDEYEVVNAMEFRDIMEMIVRPRRILFSENLF